jgi:hypothetical protein
MQPNVIPTRASVIKEVCRLGTLLSLAPRWRSFGTHPIRTVTIRRKLFAILNTYREDWGNLRILLLWSLAHAAREAEEDVERRGFAVKLAMVMDRMRLFDWKDVMRSVNSVLGMDNFTESWGVVEVALQGILRPETPMQQTLHS